MKYIVLAIVFAVISLCAFAQTDGSNFTMNADGEFVFVQKLKVKFPAKLPESEKPDFAQKAFTAAFLPDTFETFLLSESVKCESASKKFSAAYPNMSAYEILKRNIELKKSAAEYELLVLFRHKDKNLAEFLCADIARAFEYIARDASEKVRADYMELSQKALNMLLAQKAAAKELNDALKANDEVKIAELKKSLLPKKFSKEEAAEIKTKIAAFKSSQQFFEREVAAKKDKTN